MTMDNGELIDLVKVLQLENTQLKFKLEENSKRILQLEEFNLRMIQDITDCKKTETALQKSEVKYKTLVESAQDGILIIQNGIIVFANNVSFQTSGYSYNEIIGQEFTLFIPPEKREPIMKSYKKRMVDDEANCICETEIISKNGERSPVEVRISFFIYDGQKAELVLIHNIADRVAVEKSLEKEILLLRILINHLPSSIFVLDNHYRKTICNDAHIKRVEKTLDTQCVLTEADIIGKTNWDIYPKELADKYYQEDRKVIEDGETILEEEAFQIDKLGNSVWETISKIPMRDIDGSIIGMVGIAHDITKNKLGEIALQESEERYRFLFEKNPAQMLIYEQKSLKLLAVNEAFLTNYGYEKADALNMMLPDLYPENEKIPIFELATGLNGYKNVGEWHHLKSNSELITVVSSSNDIIFNGKKARVAVLIDISDRKITEGKLKASEEKFRLISNSAHDGILMLNDESKLIYWNPAVEKIFEYPGEELAFRDINELLLSANQINNENLPINISNISKTFGEIGSTFELEVIKPNGETIQVELSLAPLKISEQWGAVGIVRDITERKIVENELIQAKETAEQSDRLKSAFLATMSHELRTPLNAVIGFSSLIDETMEIPEILEMVKIINNSGNHLLNIIDSVFSLALLQAGEAKVFMEDIPLHNFLITLRPFLFTKLDKENKDDIIKIVDTEFEDNLLIIRSDKTKLTQLMVNFFDNAIKYTQKGTIEYGCKVEQSSVIFYVKDTGIGIPGDKQNIIFERFRQVEDSLTRSYGGVGLGLSICKEISDLLKGKIGLESKLGEGSTFFFKLDNVIV